MISARSDHGGGPRHMLDLMHSLKGQCEIFSASPTDAPYGAQFMKVSRGWVEIPSRSFSLFAFLRLFVFCRRNGIVLLHSHGRGAGAYALAMGILGYPVVHTFHGYHPRKNWTDRLIRLCESFLFRFSTAVIAVSQGEAKRVLEHNPFLRERLVTIPNGLPEGGKAPRSAGLLDKIILACLTRLDPQKGNDLLVKHIGALPSELRNRIEVRIAGEGPERAHLEGLVRDLSLSDCVKFVGVTNDPEGFLNNADTYVSASRGEGLSYATLESLRAGRPLLLSQVTGHDELAGIQGVFFFRLEDSADFAQGLRQLMDCDRRQVELPERFQLATMAKLTYRTYETCLGKTKHESE